MALPPQGKISNFYKSQHFHRYLDHDDGSVRYPTPKNVQGKFVQLIPAILCGGAGSRLWPVSRELHPKPFIRLADGQSLLQKAFLRGASLPGVEEILTVTNRELFFKTQDEFREVNTAGLATSFILEPFGRNTAPAAMIGFLLQHREMLWDLVKRDFVGRDKGPMLRHKGRRWSRKTQCSEADRTSLYAHKLVKIGLKAGIIRAKKA